jgi:hypothetical protein
MSGIGPLGSLPHVAFWVATDVSEDHAAFKVLVSAHSLTSYQNTEDHFDIKYTVFTRA